MDKIGFFKSLENSKIEIITDFNKTLTKPESSTSFSIIRKGNYLSENYTLKAQEMFDYYHPYEVGEIDIGDRKDMINEWWNEHLQLMVDSGLKFEMIKDIVVNKDFLMFRDEITDFFNLLESFKINIVSAGLGDIIIEMLKFRGFYNSNINVISNFFVFNDEGVSIDYKKDLVIDTLNKSKNYDFISEDKYYIVLGDSLDDLEVCKGIDCGRLLKIGFLVNKDEEEEFRKVYDIVIDRNDSMEKINKILNGIF